MKVLLVLFLMWVVCERSQAVPPTYSHTATQEYQNKRRMWMGLGFESDFNRDYKGLQVQLGAFISPLLVVDVRVTTAGSSYRGVRARPDSEEVNAFPAPVDTYPAVSEPDSEMNVARDPDNKWKVFMIEPGFAVRSQLFMDWLPLLSQWGRFGIAYTKAQDSSLGTSFTGFLFSFEAGMAYQLGKNSPWNLEATLALHAGHVTSEARNSNIGTLPLMWLTPGLGMSYFF